MCKRRRRRRQMRKHPHPGPRHPRHLCHLHQSPSPSMTRWVTTKMTVFTSSTLWPISSINGCRLRRMRKRNQRRTSPCLGWKQRKQLSLLSRRNALSRRRVCNRRHARNRLLACRGQLVQVARRSRQGHPQASDVDGRGAIPGVPTSVRADVYWTRPSGLGGTIESNLGSGSNV